MRWKRSLATVSAMLVVLAAGCASSPWNGTAAAARAEKRDCVTTKVTGSRLPRTICEGDPLDPTLTDNRRATERRSIER